MIVPTIHLNGTSREELLRQKLDALNAMEAAIAAVQAAAPHPRDYYPQPEGTFATARHRHEAKLLYLTKIRDGIEQEALAISNA